MNDIIALYGGTFNPPHVGHVRFAEEFVRLVRPKRFFVIPDYRPPHKEMDDRSPSPIDRLEMCRLAFGHIAEISDFEISNERTSYTIDTLRHFKMLFPEDKLMFLIGDDMLRGFKRWYLYREILSLCTLAVANRNELSREELEGYANELREQGGEVIILDFDARVISSTEVREGEMSGKVPDEVLNFIRERGLYMSYDLEKLRALVPSRRLAHTLGVEKAAVVLMERHFPTLSENEVRAAAILHDVTKYYSVDEHIALCESEGEKLRRSERKNKRVLHQITGSVVARQMGMSDNVCRAIRYHTTGRKKMSDIEKIILFADYIEENRDYEGLVEIRENYETLLASGDVDALDKAIVFALDTTIKEVISRGEVIHPDTIDARNYLIENISV